MRFPYGLRNTASHGKPNLTHWNFIWIKLKKLKNMQTEKDNTADREINISRLLHAPIELVWEVWTNPEHIKNWWGPNGFTNTITKMEVEPGGEWDLVMHGPDGTD